MSDNKYITINGEVKYSRTPHWIYEHEELTYKGKMVYGAIMKFADDVHSCYPSHKTLAKVCGFSVSTVKKGISELETIGAVKVINRINPDDNSKTSNFYTLEWQPIQNKTTHSSNETIPHSSNETIPQVQENYKLEPINKNQSINNIYIEKEKLINRELKTDITEYQYYQKIKGMIKNLSLKEVEVLVHNINHKSYGFDRFNSYDKSMEIVNFIDRKEYLTKYIPMEINDSDIPF